MGDDSIENLRTALDSMDIDDPFVFFSHLGGEQFNGQVNIGDIRQADPLLDMVALHVLSIQNTLNEVDSQSISLDQFMDEIQGRAVHIREERPHLMHFSEG